MNSQRTGRLLSAVGALLLIGGLFLTWYHITRAGGFVESATGFDTFTRLRVLIILGAIVVLVTAIVTPTEPVLVVRTLVGIVLGILILRRVVFPPDIADPVTSQLGVVVGLVGAVCAVLGGVVDTSREVAGRYPEMVFWRPPAGELGGGGGAPPSSANGRGRRPADPHGGVIDSTAEEL